MSAPVGVSPWLSSRYILQIIAAQEAIRGLRRNNANNYQAAGIPKLVAPTIGIAVDPRRANLSEESLAANVERLKAYKARLIVFPRKAGKPKAGDSKDIDASKVVSLVNASLPFSPVADAHSTVKKSDMPKAHEGGAYTLLRKTRSDKRNQGAREKRVRDAAEAEANKK